MFHHRQHLRRWAARTLLVWLFGIASGIAQACLTPSPMEPGAQRYEPAVEVEHGKAAAAERHHESHPAQHEGVLGHDGSLGKSSCQDFCEKSALAIPTLKSALDKVQGHALPPPAVAMMACPAPAAASVQPLTPRRDGALAPPIRLAFLRLAL